MGARKGELLRGFYLENMVYDKELLNNEEMFMRLKVADDEESEAIRNVIIKNNIRSLHVILKRRFKGNILSICELYRMTYEDMFSVCLESFLKAMDNFDVDMGFKFTTYYYRSVHLGISKFFDRLKVNTGDVSLEKVVFDGKDGQDITLLDTLQTSQRDTSEDVIAFQFARNIFNELKNRCTERDLAIMMDHVKGNLTQIELGALYGISQVQVSRIVRRTQEKARQIRDSWEAVS